MYWLVEDSLRADVGDVDIGVVLPRDIMDEGPPRRGGGPDVILGGDGSPLVTVWRPTELTEPTLRRARSVLPDRESRPSSWLITLPLLVVLSWVSSGANLGRFHSGHRLAIADWVAYVGTHPNSTHASLRIPLSTVGSLYTTWLFCIPSFGHGISLSPPRLRTHMAPSPLPIYLASARLLFWQ